MDIPEELKNAIEELLSKNKKKWNNRKCSNNK